MRIQFLFDYLSPYAYLAFVQLPQLQQKLSLQIEYCPILFPALLNHWGHKGPAEIPPKRQYVFTQCFRYATRENILFTLPKFHPFNPLTALRVSLKEVAEEKQEQVIAALWRAGWQQGMDLGNVEVIREILLHAKLPAAELLENANTTPVKCLLKDNTQTAIDAGVFGVPTFLTEDKTLFWGLDSMGDLSDYLSGHEHIDKEKLQKILQRSSSAQRIQNERNTEISR